MFSCGWRHLSKTWRKSHKNALQHRLFCSRMNANVCSLLSRNFFILGSIPTCQKFYSKVHAATLLAALVLLSMKTLLTQTTYLHRLNLAVSMHPVENFVDNAVTSSICVGFSDQFVVNGACSVTALQRWTARPRSKVKTQQQQVADCQPHRNTSSWFAFMGLHRGTTEQQPELIETNAG